MAPRNTTSTRKLTAAATPKKRGRPFGSTNKRTAIGSMRRTPIRSAGPKGTTARTPRKAIATATATRGQRGAATRSTNVVLKELRAQRTMFEQGLRAQLMMFEQILGILQKAFPGIVETLPTSQRTAA